MKQKIKQILRLGSPAEMAQYRKQQKRARLHRYAQTQQQRYLPQAPNGFKCRSEGTYFISNFHN